MMLDDDDDVSQESYLPFPCIPMMIVFSLVTKPSVLAHETLAMSLRSLHSLQSLICIPNRGSV